MSDGVSVLIEYFGNNPIIKVIDFFVDNRLFDFSKKQVAEGAGIGKVTLFKHWNKIETLGLVKMTRQFGKTKLYKLNEENPIVKKLIELELALSEKASENVLLTAKISQGKKFRQAID